MQQDTKVLDEHVQEEMKMHQSNHLLRAFQSSLYTLDRYHEHIVCVPYEHYETKAKKEHCRAHKNRESQKKKMHASLQHALTGIVLAGFLGLSSYVPSSVTPSPSIPREETTTYSVSNSTARKTTFAKPNAKNPIHWEAFAGEGIVPILTYHGFDGKRYDDPLRQRYQLSPEAFRKQLLWMHAQGFQTLPLDAYVRGDYSLLLPGKKPLIITADDAYPEQFLARRTKEGTLEVDPSCMIGVLLAVASLHPDFGHYATLFVDFDNTPFGQEDLLEEKLHFLLDNNIGIGTHTSRHRRLDKLSIQEALQELALPYVFLEQYLGERIDEVNLHAYPYSIPPCPEVLAIIQKEGGVPYKGKVYPLIAAFHAQGKEHPSSFAPFDDPLHIVRREVYHTNYNQLLTKKEQYIAQMQVVYVHAQ